MQNKALFLLIMIKVNLGKWGIRSLLEPRCISYMCGLDSMLLVDKYFF